MAMPQRDDLIDEIRKTDLLLEYAVQHGEVEEAERFRAKLRRLAAMGDRDESMKKLAVSFALSVVVAFVTGAAVLDKAYLTMDRPAVGESAISESEALVFRSDGDRIYGQVLKPNAAFGKGRPVVIFCHGFAGFTRMDDVAQALCRAGCVALVPHHRGAWGSEGKYTITNAINDAVNLVDYVSSEEFSAKYGTDPKLVFLCGYSMGGNTVLHAALLRPKVRGVILQAPCDVAYCMRSVSKEQAFKFLFDNGLEVLRTDGAATLYGEIMAAADRLEFKTAAAKMKDRNVMLAVGRYDHVVPREPIDAFWSALNGNNAVRVRKDYPTSHGFMGVRVAFAADVADFILAASSPQ